MTIFSPARRPIPRVCRRSAGRALQILLLLGAAILCLQVTDSAQTTHKTSRAKPAAAYKPAKKTTARAARSTASSRHSRQPTYATKTHQAAAARTWVARHTAQRLRSAGRSADPATPAHSYAVTRIPYDATAGPVAPTGSPFLYEHNLDPFFAALSAQQQHAPDAPETIRVLQFGDSHTAADIFSGAVRAAFQEHFGDGGLGFQFPGHPFAGYHLAGSTRSQTSGWSTQGNHFTDLGDGDLGLGGIGISTARAGEAISLTTTCTTFQLEFLRQPGGGRLTFTDNGVDISDIDTDSQTDFADAATSTRGPGTFTYACTPGPHNFVLTTLDAAPVRLLGLVTEQPGVTWECLGINGAVAPLMLRWNQQIFSEYLRQRNPNLIVLAYGTNEAAESASYNDDYVQKFTHLLDLLHQYVPDAAILVLGPYDRATAHTVRVSRRRSRTYWETYAGTQRIIADQEAACRVHHCAYYNEQTRMGGPGAMLRWAAAGLAQGDHTHLTGTGYRELAGALYDDLINAYKSYQQTSTPAPAASAP
jgi:lysophospholipase L1-like esterase